MQQPSNTTLWNPDLAPTTASQRTWRWYHFAALWVGMVMCIPAYTLSASLIENGMSASQAVITVFLANAIVLLPMLLIGHAGTKYGIPYAVLARSSFGTKGARLTSHVTMAGRFLVFMPTVDHVGISRKIESREERGRLRDIVREFRDARGFTGGVIIRTAASVRPKEDIVSDLATVPASVLAAHQAEFEGNGQNFKKTLRSMFASDDFVKF